MLNVGQPARAADEEAGQQLGQGDVVVGVVGRCVDVPLPLMPAQRRQRGSRRKGRQLEQGLPQNLLPAWDELRSTEVKGNRRAMYEGRGSAPQLPARAHQCMLVPHPGCRRKLIVGTVVELLPNEAQQLGR